MYIHRMEKGQTVKDVARHYGVDEDILRMNNSLAEGEPAIGEELLILTPTRTYTVRRGDSAERLALRFGIMRRDIFALNPTVSSEGLPVGKRIALKYGERKYGAGCALGYFYSGGDINALRERLPLITYLAVAAAILDHGRLSRIFDGRDAVGLVRGADKTPLLRIYARDGGYRTGDEDELIENMLYAAISGGYKGLVLGGEAPGEELLMKLRRKMIGSDLILFTELTGSSEAYLSELADGSVLASPDSGDGCADALHSFATRCESNRCLPELPCFALCGESYIPTADALLLARRGGYAIDRADGKCRFIHKRNGEYIFPSLESIKATLEAVHEYGYMGISYDISRVPTAYLMMFEALFGSRG
ncbi:MAG: LysM peptidoglycan-binding domain-containing protein [Clostridia bacterium]|nr:LysM peptidoglycan-binding domain-containing protein [Clostridia bacterium]